MKARKKIKFFIPDVSYINDPTSFWINMIEVSSDLPFPEIFIHNLKTTFDLIPVSGNLLLLSIPSFEFFDFVSAYNYLEILNSEIKNSLSEFVDSTFEFDLIGQVMDPCECSTDSDDIVEIIYDFSSRPSSVGGYYYEHVAVAFDNPGLVQLKHIFEALENCENEVMITDSLILLYQIEFMEFETVEEFLRQLPSVARALKKFGKVKCIEVLVS